MTRLLGERRSPGAHSGAYLADFAGVDKPKGGSYISRSFQRSARRTPPALFSPAAEEKITALAEQGF
jgi:hypothetical protein